LSSPHEVITRPLWVGREVTDDPRFRNSKLTPMSRICERLSPIPCAATACA
jgi:CYTH domain-containing protein